METKSVVPAGPLERIVSQNDGCYRDDGQPVKCWKCGGTEINEKVRDSIEGWGVMEFECLCGGCGESIGYWAYGSYDPSYMGYHREMMVANG